MRFSFSRSSGQRPPGPRLTATNFGAAAGAGFAAAIMVVAVVKNVSGGVIPLNAGSAGFPPSLILPAIMILIVPLPLMIVAIGFGRLAGILAVLIGSAAVGLFALMPAGAGSLDLERLVPAGAIGLIFAVTFGIPSVLLGRLAVSRKELPPDPPIGAARPDEQVLGRVVAVAIVYTAVVLVAVFTTMIVADGGFSVFFAELMAQIKQHPAALSRFPAGVDLHRVVKLEIWLICIAFAGFCVCVLACNLWLAARIAQTSSLLSGPWPNIPRNLRVPRPFALLLAVALGLSFAGGLVGTGAAIVTGALLAGFVFQGLAVIHALTLGNRFRLTLLTLVYFFFFVMPVPLIFALIGLLDAFFAFRDRQKPKVVKKT